MNGADAMLALTVIYLFSCGGGRLYIDEDNWEMPEELASHVKTARKPRDGNKRCVLARWNVGGVGF